MTPQDSHQSGSEPKVRRDWRVPVLDPDMPCPVTPPADIITTPYTTNVLRDVANERQRQDEKWGPVNRPPLEWLGIAAEEFGEVAEKVVKGWVPPESDFDREGYRTELIQLAAVCVSAVEDLDYGTAGLGRSVKALEDLCTARDGALRLLARTQCPYYQGTGICESGCDDEPACYADEPTGGWAKGAIEELAATLPEDDS